MVETDSHYEEAPPAAAQHHHQTYFHIEHGKSESRLQLQRLVASWVERRPDVCLLSSDNQRVFSHRSLLSLHSRTLLSVLHTRHLHHEPIDGHPPARVQVTEDPSRTLDANAPAHGPGYQGP